MSWLFGEDLDELVSATPQERSSSIHALAASLDVSAPQQLKQIAKQERSSERDERQTVGVTGPQTSVTWVDSEASFHLPWKVGKRCPARLRPLDVAPGAALATKGCFGASRTTTCTSSGISTTSTIVRDLCFSRRAGRIQLMFSLSWWRRARCTWSAGLLEYLAVA